MPIVYLATNLVNGKRYVGVTSDLLCKRKAKHLNGARSGKGNCRKFHAAIRKYGEESFEWTVVFRSEGYQEAIVEEIRLIAALRPEYNLTAGGEGTVGFKHPPESTEKRLRSRAGWKASDETRHRLSEALKGHVVSQETRKKLSVAMKKRVLSEQAKANILVAALRGKPHSQETKLKMSATRKGRKRPAWVTAKIVATKVARGIYRRQAMEASHAV